MLAALQHDQRRHLQASHTGNSLGYHSQAQPSPWHRAVCVLLLTSCAAEVVSCAQEHCTPYTSIGQHNTAPHMLHQRRAAAGGVQQV
jgi:hypothetical protein